MDVTAGRSSSVPEQDHPAGKVCPLCGDMFVPERPNQKFCRKLHERTCEVCGTRFVIPDSRRGRPPRTCSPSCAAAAGHTSASDDRRRSNSLIRHGTEYPSQDEAVKSRIRSAVEADPQRDHRIGSENFTKRLKELYGVENVSSLEPVKEKRRRTSLSRYGTQNPTQNEDVKRKYRSTMSARHGSRRSDQLIVKDFENYSHIDTWLRNFRKVHGHGPSISETAVHFGVTQPAISRLKSKLELSALFDSTVSLREALFKNFLKEHFPDVRYIHNDRSVISPLELDFFFPDHSFAVEISPTSTHHSSTSFLNFGKNMPKDRNYHRNKMIEAEKAGVELLTVFDWMPWNSVIEMICHKLSGSGSRVPARRTTSHLVRKSDGDKGLLKSMRNFIRENHILGFDGRGVLFYNYLDYEGTIIGVAAWGRPRSLNVHRRRTSENSDRPDRRVELLRMCFVSGMSVPGGASKLVRNFIRNNETVEEIVTFSDCDLGTGHVYDRIGFDLVERSRPQLVYVHPRVMRSDGRPFIVRGTSLQLVGADRLLKNFPNYKKVGIGDNLPSNREIVESYGFLPVYDCGYKKWLMKVR